MIKIKLLGLLSFLFAWGQLAEAFKARIDELIQNGFSQESIDADAKCQESLWQLTFEEKMKYYQELDKIKNDAIQRLEEHRKANGVGYCSAENFVIGA